MGPYEWAGLVGGPLLILTTRALVSAYFNFRIESLSVRLKDQQQERNKTIQKLKDATKYDSTLELIEKYGGGEGNPAEGQGKGKGGKIAEADNNAAVGTGKPTQARLASTPGRTTMPPPPTANIQRQPGHGPKANILEPSAEFAPNAEYSHSLGPPPALLPHLSQQSYTQQHTESRWYDRLFDVILGEDETAPKNRIVLLCTSCRLVNGQAPPGVKSLVELGKWRCMGCGVENGVEEDEGKRIVREVLADQASAPGRDDRKDAEGQSAGPIVTKVDDEVDSPLRRRPGRGEKGDTDE